MDSSRDDSGARNDYWRGGAGGSEGRRGRGGGGRGSYARAEGDRGASPSRGARGRGRGDGKASHGDSRRGFQSPRGGGNASSHASADRRHGGRGGRGGGGGGRGRNVEPCSALAAERKNKMRQHTGTLSSCESCDAVLEYASEHARTFTAVNFSTAIHKLGKLNRSARGRRTKHAARLIDDPRFADLETALAASLALFASPTRVDAPERRRVPRRLGRARGVLRAVGLRQLRQDRGDVERRCRVEHLQRRGLRALPGALRRFAAQSRRLRRRRVFVAESVKRGVGAGEDAQRPAESESRRGFFRCRTRSAFGVGRSANGLSGRARGSRHGRAGGRDPRPAGAPAERRRVHPAGRLQLDVGARRFEKTRAPTAVRRRRERRGR